MLKLEVVLLCALSALHLQGGVVAGEPQALEMCGNQSNTNNNNVRIQLAKSPIEVSDSEAKISDSAAKISKLPKEYEKIGKRYFYIEKSTTIYSWFNAFNRCRQMGGQLATIESEKELTAIVGKLPRTFYWLGVTNLANRNVYTSVGSGKKVNFLHWGDLQPDKHKNENCICLNNKVMHDYPCDTGMQFICEAEV